ncbi:MAG: ATP-binding protein [Magnetococcales bacterium]|nr:ATP-binding protein [Magnetococcales bacterium]
MKRRFLFPIVIVCSLLLAHAAERVAWAAEESALQLTVKVTLPARSKPVDRIDLTHITVPGADAPLQLALKLTPRARPLSVADSQAAGVSSAVEAATTKNETADSLPEGYRELLWIAVPLLITIWLLLWGWRRFRRGSKPPAAVSEKQQTVRCELTCLPSNLIPLVGRTTQLRQLDHWLADPAVAIVTCTAPAGTGKTALVEGWLDGLQPRFGGARRVFAWTFQQASIAHARSAVSGPDSSGLFFVRALRFFGHEGELPDSEEKRAVCLVRLLHAQPALLILDGVERLQYADETPGEQLADTFADPGLYHFIRRMALPPSDHKHKNSLLVITSQRLVRQEEGNTQRLQAWRPISTVCRSLALPNLSEREGVQLLSKLGVAATYRKRLPAMVRQMHGHALTLLILGGLLSRSERDGGPTILELERWLEPGEVGEHCQRLLHHYDENVWPKQSQHGLALRLFGLLDRPMRDEEWQVIRSQAHLAAPLRDLDFASCATLFDELEQAGLLTPYSTHCGWQMHSVVREFFAKDLEDEFTTWIADMVDDAPPAWENPLCQAHETLFNHFRTAVEKELPDGRIGLEPLYRAVQHGCRAGRYRQALHTTLLQRIRRQDACFSLAKLGAYSSDLAALSAFFPTGWDAPPVRGDLTPEDRIWLLAEAIYCLAAVGRVEEALRLQEEGVRLEMQRGSPHGGAMASAALCDLQLAMGRLRAALETAEQGKQWADRHQLPLLSWLLQSKRAAVLLRLGDGAASMAAFQEAATPNIAQLPAEWLPFLGMVERVRMELLLEQQAVPLPTLLQQLTSSQQQVKTDSQSLWTVLHLLNQGRILAAMGDIGASMTALLQATMIAEEREGETPLSGDILCQRAAILRQQGDRQAAWWDLLSALEIARRWQLPLLEVDSRLLQGELLMEERRFNEVEAVLERIDLLIKQTEYNQRREAAKHLRTRWLAARSN